MAKADLNVTMFGNDPTKAPVVIDSYDGDMIGSFIKTGLGSLSSGASGLSSSLMGMLPGLSMEKITSLLGDNALVSFLAEAGTNVFDFVKAIVVALPNGVSLSDLLNNHGILEISDFVNSLKAQLPPSDWLTLGTDIFLVMMDAKKRYLDAAPEDAIGGIKGLLYKELAGLLGATGIDFDFLTKAAYSFGLTQKLFESGLAQDAIEWLVNSDMPSWVKEMIFKDLVDIAAGLGLYDEMTLLIQKAQGAYEPWRRAKTIRTMLSGYLLPNQFKPQDIEAEGTRLANALFGLDSNWLYYKRDTAIVLSTYYFNWASGDALYVLRREPRCKVAANTFFAIYPEVLDWRYLAGRQFEFLVLR